MELHPDFRALLAALARASAEYMVIGGYAVGFHGRPRYTKDIDIYFRDTPENRGRLADALYAFGAPTTVVAGARDGAASDVLWMGQPPSRVDFLAMIEGVDFDDAYRARVDTEWNGVRVCVIGIDALIANKRAVGRDQDLLDVKQLENLPRR